MLATERLILRRWEESDAKMCENKNYRHHLPELEQAEKEYEEMMKKKTAG